MSDLSGTLAGVRIGGSLAYAPENAEPLDGALTADRLALLRLLALVTGSSSGAAPWSDGRFAPAALAGFPFRTTLDIANLDLPGGLVMTGTRLRLRHDGSTLSADDIVGAVADGRASGNFKLRRRGENVEADGHIALAGVDVAKLVTAAGGRTVLKGQGTLSLDLTGSGRSPLALAQALAGQGSLAIENFDLAGTDPRSLQYVMLGTERGAPPDNRRLSLLFDQALARGPLRLPRIEAPLSVIGGTVKTGTARTAIGALRFAATGNFDLARLALDASLDMEDASDPRASAPPGATISWRGPFAAPERRLDVSALGAAINMRAVERETKRLEAVYGRSPVMDAGSSTGDAPGAPTAPVPAPPPASGADQAPSATESPPAVAPSPPPPRTQAPRPRVVAPVRVPQVEPRALPPAGTPPFEMIAPPDSTLRPPGSVPDAQRGAVPSFP